MQTNLLHIERDGLPLTSHSWIETYKKIVILGFLGKTPFGTPWLMILAIN